MPLSIASQNPKPVLKLPVASYGLKEKLDVQSGRLMTMTESVFPIQISLSKPNNQPSSHNKHNHKYPMNKQSKKHDKMEAITEESKDEEMTDQNTTASSKTPTQASARLLAKLQKLRETKPMSIPKSIKTTDMEIDDLKKCMWAPTPLAGMQLTKAVQHQKGRARTLKKGTMAHHPESFKNGQKQQCKMKQ